MADTSTTQNRKATRRAKPQNQLPKRTEQVEERPKVTVSSDLLAQRKAARQAARAAAEGAPASSADASPKRASRKKTPSSKVSVPKAGEGRKAGRARLRRKEDPAGVSQVEGARQDAKDARPEDAPVPSARKADEHEKVPFPQVLYATPLRRNLLITLGVVVALVVTLFGPVRAYYVAWRTELDLQARYQAILDENDELVDDIDRLRTREGIEDEARKRGYVNPGETSVVVRGLPDDNDVGGSKANDVVAEVPWYITALDGLFGYEGI